VAAHPTSGVRILWGDVKVTDFDAEGGPRLRLHRALESASIARRFVERVLSERAVPDAVIERAKLVASELVTNALRHGRGAVELRLAFSSDHVRIEVIDEGWDQVVAVRERPADETGGWGLQIVDRLAAQWGVFEGTTHVWAEVPLEA
jgi:anti-sigma regulatory factor (Ser/Thr protein kinase)